MRNIRAINFNGNPIPEGIDTYLKEQIKFIRKMIGNVNHVAVTHS